MKFFVTGGTGFLGSRLVRQLRAAGHGVVALVRSPAKAADLSALGVELAPGDVTLKESMRAPMTGVDGVFHVAGWYRVGVSDTRPAAAINIDGTRHVLELMRELGVPRGVYTSTLAVNSDTHGALVDERYRYDGPHLSEYDRTKAAAHDLALAFIAQGLPLVIVQPGVIYGKGDVGPIHDVFEAWLARRLPAVPRGAAYCWAHVDDVAAGHLLAMERGVPGESYFLAGPPHTLLEALQIAEGITGVPAPRRTIPAGLLRRLSPIARALEGVLPIPPSYRSETLRVGAGVTYLGSNAKAREALGWQPRDLETGLREMLQTAT